MLKCTNNFILFFYTNKRSLKTKIITHLYEHKYTVIQNNYDENNVTFFNGFRF